MVDVLKRDCKNFDMPVPEFFVLEETRTDILTLEATWKFFGEWQDALDALGDLKWIAFRVRLFAFEEFLDSWSGQVRKRPADSVTLYVQESIDGLRKLAPLLKYVAGEAFVDDHWIDLFRKLRIKGAKGHDRLQL